MAFEERHYLEELGNIVKNWPLWPGDTISHQTAYECGRRGWAKRNWGPAQDGCWYPTEEGERVWKEHLASVQGEQGEGE
jgi:hypothetical protein